MEVNKLKKYIALIATLFIFALSSVGCSLDKNKIGKTKMYVHITENGKEVNEKGSDGETYSRYFYKLKAYDKNGKEDSVTFSAGKNLKLDAFLRVYVTDKTDSKGNKEIGTFEEVKASEIPQEAKEKLNVK